MPTHPLSVAPIGPVLVIEAATSAGSIALLERQDRPDPWRVVSELAVSMGSGREDLLTPAISGLLADAGLSPAGLCALACGAGPGSFTSLRIAAALAKGLAFSRDLPVFALPSLLLAIPSTPAGGPSPGRYLVALDALRGECFVQPVEVASDGRVLTNGAAARVPREALAETADGATLVEIALEAGVHPVASAARWLADWSSFGPVDLDGWEPAYGRLAEAQVKWEATHGRPLPAA
jgi:tRNA threonylcarbamoyladenosine biosynthesis protein TsaB